MSTGAMSKQVSIEDFVAGLRKFSESAFTHTEEIASFLEKSPVAPETLEPYLAWDRQHYTRNLIDKTVLYELIAICWEVGQASSVHNHRDQNCWMAIVIRTAGWRCPSGDCWWRIIILSIRSWIKANAS
ncbi:MAG: hypothetical protein DMG98_28235 [Acidobacteria bacterium]|nr:MAG: hypothetical protein DMG98_28235 [Acidobacteriota bacterium]